ncbi:MAG: phenylacetate--CoA ligase family protein [Bacteroidetes bacterium]|nr:MAG: phenylacetate--CoA ligase family protein [Bacteroidota bacterium]
MDASRLLEHLVLPLGDFATGGAFVKELRSARAVAAFTRQQIDELSKRKLHRLLLHATQNSVHYAPFAAGATPEAHVQEWLQQFPILDKPTLRVAMPQMLTQPQKGLVKCASSGSTGFQSITYQSKKQRSITRAVQTLWWEWAGYRLGQPILQTGITPNRSFEKTIKDRLFQTYYLHAFAHGKDEAIKALLWAKRQNKPALGGYSSSLYVLATMALEAGIEVKFKTAFTWGDKLFDHYRATIQKAFGCKTFESYGSAEGFMMAGQGDQDTLYQMSPYVWLEIVDDAGNTVPDGEIGNVIVTNLDSYAMPMIRYKVGDLAIKLPADQYPAQSKFNFPQLQKVVGRDTDLVKTRSGKYMVVHSFTGIFEHLPEVSQFCVVQSNLDGINIQYIPGKGFQAAILNHIAGKILAYLQEPFDISFTEVTHIAPTKSGKPQLIVSTLQSQAALSSNISA